MQRVSNVKIELFPENRFQKGEDSFGNLTVYGNVMYSHNTFGFHVSGDAETNLSFGDVVKEDEYIIDGSAHIDDVNEMIGTHIESEDFDTIGGFVIGVLGTFPEAGETVEYDGIKFVVEEIDKNRIEKLRIHT